MDNIKEKLKRLRESIGKDAIIAGTAMSAVSPAMATPNYDTFSNNSPTPMETQVSTAPGGNIVASLNDTANEPSFGSPEWQQAQTGTPRSNNKYTTKITVRNDTVTMVGGTGGYYTPSAENEIRILKGDLTPNDFGFQNMPAEHDENLILVHENQHRINRSVKNVGAATLSLNEDYQRNVHDEITALIAEKLEIRRQYKAAQTPEAKNAVLQKYARDPAHKEYINAIQSGRINPDSMSSQDFAAEMTFIKEDATHYRADPDDQGYGKSWTKLAMSYLNSNGANIRSNPAALAAEVHSMYQIGGIDFTQYGAHSDFVIENQSVIAADNLLAQGAAPEKIIAFMNIGEGPFSLAESLDVSGLSREQAEQVLQTAIMTQDMNVNITSNLCFGDKTEFDYDFMARNLREKTALYLDLKSDIWQKNNTLTEQGDAEKFNRLMQQAQTTTIDLNAPEIQSHLNWCLTHRTPPFTPEQLVTIRQNMAQLDGQNINVTNIIANIDEAMLPLDGTSVEEVISAKRQKEEEDKKFWEEYYASHPEKGQNRLSETYEVEIMDLQSNILSDELQSYAPRNNAIEPMYPPLASSRLQPLDGGFQLKAPQYDKAEFTKTANPDGTSTEVVLIDGKKHGAEITTAADGSQLSFKLYNHGQEIDLSTNSINVKTEVQDGASHSYILLNGERFGTETITMPDGTTKAAFYDEGGMPISNTETSAISRVEITRSDLKQELLNQQGFIADNPLSRAQSIRIGSRSQNARADSHAQNQSQSRQQNAQNTISPEIAALSRTR